MTFGDGATNWLQEIQEISFGFKNATMAFISIMRRYILGEPLLSGLSISYQPNQALGESQFLVWKEKFETIDTLNANDVWKLISTTV